MLTVPSPQLHNTSSPEWVCEFGIRCNSFIDDPLRDKDQQSSGGIVCDQWAKCASAVDRVWEE